MSPPTGIASVDAVVRAVERRDTAALLAMVEYSRVRCGTAPGIGGPPPCPAGTTAGTEVEVLPTPFCEGELTPPPLLSALVTQGRLGQGADRFYGVIRPLPRPHPQLPGGATPAAEYGVVFRAERFAGLDIIVQLSNGRIVALEGRGPCGGPLPPLGDPAWVVPPRQP